MLAGDWEWQQWAWKKQVWLGYEFKGNNYPQNPQVKQRSREQIQETAKDNGGVTEEHAENDFFLVIEHISHPNFPVFGSNLLQKSKQNVGRDRDGRNWTFSKGKSKIRDSVVEHILVHTQNKQVNRKQTAAATTTKPMT